MKKKIKYEVTNDIEKVVVRDMSSVRPRYKELNNKPNKKYNYIRETHEYNDYTITILNKTEFYKNIIIKDINGNGLQFTIDTMFNRLVLLPKAIIYSIDKENQRKITGNAEIIDGSIIISISLPVEEETIIDCIDHKIIIRKDKNLCS